MVRLLAVGIEASDPIAALSIDADRKILERALNVLNPGPGASTRKMAVFPASP
jgi:hypothetical protein